MINKLLIIYFLLYDMSGVGGNEKWLYFVDMEKKGGYSWKW